MKKFYLVNSHLKMQNPKFFQHGQPLQIFRDSPLKLSAFTQSRASFVKSTSIKKAQTSKFSGLPVLKKISLKWILVIACLCVFSFGCGESIVKENSELSALPYIKVAKSDMDPADNGPGDDMVLDFVNGNMGKVKFPHFSHASTDKNGFFIPCAECHHTADKNEFPSSGCQGCHIPNKATKDPADFGPDDNLTIFSYGKMREVPVVFNHFTHASDKGYKLTCTTCHHTGEIKKCSQCHKEIATLVDGGTVPAEKRAFHLKCKNCHEALVKNNPASPAPIACSNCHLEKQDFPSRGQLSLQRVFHQNCIECHKKVNSAKKNSKAPYKDCAGCHLKGTYKIPTAKDLEPKKPEPKKPAVKTLPVADNKSDTKADAGDDKADGDEDKGPENILIDYAKKLKTGTPFPHHLHQEMAESCENCHHKGLDDPSCKTCHATPADAKKVFHSNCITCHKEKNIPTGCVNCHPKE